CFRRDEVVALAGVIEFTDGTFSKAWHIPGRKKNLKSDGTVFTQTKDQYGHDVSIGKWDTEDSYATTDDNFDGVSERYKLYNTASKEGNSSTGGDFGMGFYGEMGFYESEEKYDCNEELYGEDAGKPIRHHLMPDCSVLHIHDGLDGTRTIEQRVKISYLGIKLPNIDDILNTLPPDIKKTVKGWRIVVGDRTYDKSVRASGIMLNALKQDW